MKFNQPQQQYIKKLIKKAREAERKQIRDIIAKRSFTQKMGGQDYQIIDTKELCVSCK